MNTPTRTRVPSDNLNNCARRADQRNFGDGHTPQDKLQQLCTTCAITDRRTYGPPPRPPPTLPPPERQTQRNDGPVGHRHACRRPREVRIAVSCALPLTLMFVAVVTCIKCNELSCEYSSTLH